MQRCQHPAPCTRVSAITQVAATVSQQRSVHADDNCRHLSDFVSVHTYVMHTIAESPLTDACFAAEEEHRAKS